MDAYKKAKKIMIDRDMEMNGLAKEVGCDRSWVRHILQGRFHGSPEIRRRIARALGTTVEELWGEPDPAELQAA